MYFILCYLPATIQRTKFFIVIFFIYKYLYFFLYASIIPFHYFSFNAFQCIFNGLNFYFLICEFTLRKDHLWNYSLLKIFVDNCLILCLNSVTSSTIKIVLIIIKGRLSPALEPRFEDHLRRFYSD